MKRSVILFTLFLLASTSVISQKGQKKYPKVSIIGSDTVVIWTLSQDKANSMVMERGRKLFKDVALFIKDTTDLREVIRVQDKLFGKKSLQLKICHARYAREVVFRETAQEEAKFWEGQYKKAARKNKLIKRFAPYIVGVVAVGSAYLGFRAGVISSRQ